MTETKSKLTNTIKWIFFIPIGILIYKFSNTLISFIVYPFDKVFVMEIIYSRDFGEYTIIGPTFIFLREIFNVSFATYYGIYFVPKYKKTVFIFISSFWLLIVILTTIATLNEYSNNEFTVEKLYRIFTEMSAQIIGFLISGFYIWKNNKKKKSFIPYKMELIIQADIIRKQIFHAFPDFEDYPDFINKNYTDLVLYFHNDKLFKKDFKAYKVCKNEEEIVLICYYYAFLNSLENAQTFKSEYKKQPLIILDWTKKELNDIGISMN